jgi:hypothetical protein
MARDENHDDYVGNCEGCDKMLFVGDVGLRCDDGPVLCAEHAPTWAEAKTQWDAGENFDKIDSERHVAFMESYNKHIAEGGSVDDKFTHTF